MPHPSTETRQAIDNLHQQSFEGLEANQRGQLHALLKHFTDICAARDEDCTHSSLIRQDSVTGDVRPNGLHPCRLALARRFTLPWVSSEGSTFECLIEKFLADVPQSRDFRIAKMLHPAPVSTPPVPLLLVSLERGALVSPVAPLTYREPTPALSRSTAAAPGGGIYGAWTSWASFPPLTKGTATSSWPRTKLKKVARGLCGP